MAKLTKRTAEQLRSHLSSLSAVTQGLEAGDPAVVPPGPALPAEAATKTLASAANRKETSLDPPVGGRRSRSSS